ncbi:MAG TPA: diaminopimelate epimerase, partial [Candidatus Avipropionibacterium avicola]|nr:diaminopimelate epimerase [Candidatus Avipropionibacterium avicola]
MRIWSFAKGHGTGNDFVILLDRHAMADPTAEEVRQLCDRHRSVGGDGLLRVVRARSIEGWDGDPDLWFMDYRNADGSLAEMCGNGARVFARYLAEQDLVSGPEFDIATRAGVKRIELTSRGLVRVAMGPVRVGGEVTIGLGGQQHRGWSAEVGNPHAVVGVDADALTGLDLSRAPQFSEQDFADGVNVEFVTEPGDRDEVRMRVHERGVGETLSCGTGTVAAA